MMIDIDHFKACNDTSGHSEGDDCLKLAASTISAKVSGPRNLVARYGGEEFIVFFCDTSITQALTAAERIRSAVEEIPIAEHGAGARRQITVSLGVTVARLSTREDVQSALEKADQALYQSKANGRNRFTRL